MNIKSRLLEYLAYKKVGQTAFERKAGISNGYISRVKGSIGSTIIPKILSASEDLNRDWLLYGEGEMLIQKHENDVLKSENNTENTRTVPLLPISAQGGSLNDFVKSVSIDECEKVISPIRYIDFAMSVSGDSMSPEYPSGSQILIKKINEKAFIDWGRVYVLDTCNGSVIKKIMPSVEKNKIKCVSINPDYPPFEISFDDIYGIYRVMLCMATK